MGRTNGRNLNRANANYGRRIDDAAENSEFKANSKPALVVREIDQVEGAARGG